MGGRGSGGRRPGAGRKPPRLRVVEIGAAPVVTVPAVPQPPSWLSADAATVWRTLAPLAVERQTLTAATAHSFEMLCRNVVLERQLAADPKTVGGPNHRGILQRVDAELLRFDLSPNGKPHGQPVGVAPEKPKSALERLKERRQGLKVVS